MEWVLPHVTRVFITKGRNTRGTRTEWPQEDTGSSSHLQAKGRGLWGAVPAGTLILNFQLPELGANSLLLFQPLTLWCAARAAQQMSPLWAAGNPPAGRAETDTHKCPGPGRKRRQLPSEQQTSPEKHTLL